MQDRLLREIRDRLSAIAAMLAALLAATMIAVCIFVYWHLKAEKVRQRLLEDDRPPASSPITRQAGALSR